ncbi:hypothetical protein BKA56DRAFT_14918 [Ilyonectria sp. MPI-CAGE-AT-0026]|nr:hypothetical protein BKA56DRAFT_14918 [Ilyonectria sp. MPI-CAGE-AT-0026]
MRTAMRPRCVTLRSASRLQRANGLAVICGAAANLQPPTSNHRRPASALRRADLVPDVDARAAICVPSLSTASLPPPLRLRRELAECRGWLVSTTSKVRRANSHPREQLPEARERESL